ncbi:hypothetical protein SBOR_3340 [Sclerotinia borealis F-4128]|uniref:Uncharacterized protein n=1 Tax=Sclerotinia borealis (strain F-4128) TaxID=1432307 RepID=W9CP62_SCLBF|nr:hypothetical protein SBOR_3340 [Sclerotinia borealis F-4128]
MADNLCGPSNALQNLQKHTKVDRTLQQDRLVGRASTSQGFRASPGLNAGQLDAEFAAFQAGHQSLSLSPSAQNLSPRHFHTPSPQNFQTTPPQHPADRTWATDFRNLNISGPQAQFQQQEVHRTHQPQMGGWHQEFAQSYRAPSVNAQGKQPVMGMHGPSMMNAGYNSIPRVLMQQNQFTSTIQSSAQNDEVIDDAAFARAFDEAANAELERERKQEEESERARVEQETAIQAKTDEEAGLERDRAVNYLLNQAPLGADTIQDPATATSEQNTHAPDALSRTAGELLHSVSSNQSDKFQNSQFLQLMRQIRDKEVTVEGDMVVDTGMRIKRGVYENENGGQFHDMTSDVAERIRKIRKDDCKLAEITAGMDQEMLMKACEAKPKYHTLTRQKWVGIWARVERGREILRGINNNPTPELLEHPVVGYLANVDETSNHYVVRDNSYYEIKPKSEEGKSKSKSKSGEGEGEYDQAEGENTNSDLTRPRIRQFRGYMALKEKHRHRGRDEEGNWHGKGWMVENGKFSGGKKVWERIVEGEGRGENLKANLKEEEEEMGIRVRDEGSREIEMEMEMRSRAVNRMENLANTFQPAGM